MRAILRRLETGERWWAAEVVFRATGVALLALCWSAATRLLHDANQPQAHGPTALECALAAAAVLCWWFGTAVLWEGPGLFKLIPILGRHAGFPS